MGNYVDNIKQFCAENKKYVGVAGVLVGLILILIVVVAGGNNGRQSNTEAGSQTEISVKDFEFEKDYTNDAKDDISTLLADYYKAYVGDDLDTLGKLATPMSDNEKSYIGVVSQYYESVNDITPYTKNGLKKGTYFVSVKNSIKFTGVDTQAPTLDFFYIETGKDGKLFINNVYSNFNRTYCENALDDDIMELISKYTASSEFADLHEEVQKAYEQAVGSDANLKTMLETTLTGAIKQWYTSSGIANLKKSDADYDAVCIFDADNIVDKNFIKNMNKKLCQGEDVVQGYRDIKNPTDSWVTAGYAIFYWTMHRFYHLARYNIGLSPLLNGTGFMVRFDILKPNGWVSGWMDG